MEPISYTKEELEESIDLSKIVILKALVEDGLLDFETTEKWSENNTVILKKKSFFRTLSEKWNNKKEENKYYFMVVKRKGD